MSPFVHAAAVRAVRTAAQAALASLGTTAVIQSVDWEIVAGTSALAALLSVLTSLAGLPEVEGE
jgi:hypothetical protein